MQLSSSNLFYLSISLKYHKIVKKEEVVKQDSGMKAKAGQINATYTLPKNNTQKQTRELDMGI